MPERSADAIDLVFLDDAGWADGVPVNFSDTTAVAPLVKYAEFSAARQFFRHRRLGAGTGRPGYLVIGLLGSPYEWTGRDGSPPLAARLAGIARALDADRGLRLLIDYSWEAGLGEGFFVMVEEFVAGLGIDPARAVLLVSNSGIAARHAAHLQATGTPAAATFRVIGAELFLLYSAVEFRLRHWHGGTDSLPSAAAVEARAGTPRGRKFLSLNRRPRWHRFLLALMLRQLDLVPEGYVSMPSLAYRGDWQPETGLVYQNGKRMAPAIWGTLDPLRIPTFASLPWTLDVAIDDSGHTSEHAYRNQLGDVFLDSYLQVVTESYFEAEPGDVVLTEKLCKAIGHLQPCILFGTQGTLARLAALGFVMPPGIPTRYDPIAHTGKRLSELYRCLAELKAMSIADLHAIYHAGVEALLHNRHLLFRMPEILGGEIATRLRLVAE